MVYGLRLNFFFPSDIFFIYNLSITVRKKKRDIS
jgi:hypothetical protein